MKLDKLNICTDCEFVMRRMMEKDRNDEDEDGRTCIGYHINLKWKILTRFGLSKLKHINWTKNNQAHMLAHYDIGRKNGIRLAKPNDNVSKSFFMAIFN